MFTGKVLMITGGTGTFGNGVLERFLNTNVKEIRIFSRDEKKQSDMRKKFPSDRIKYYIGNVRNIQSIKDAIKDVDYLFHAAALKQVPSCEFFPMEAVRTNILGTDNVLTAAIEAGVKKVICLSTDKAAYPISAMGISKSMMEKVMIAKSRLIPQEQTMICGTRYGNIMASRGSVIPLWIEQILAGKPLTVTSPNMTRFFMTVEEAVNLVLFAFEHGNSGDIFVHKAPSCTIGDLVTALLDIFNAKNPIRIIGSRHGEKLHEPLLTREEFAIAKDMGDFFKVPCDNRNLNYNRYFVDGVEEIFSDKEYCSNNTTQLNVNEIKEMLLNLDIVKKELKHIRLSVAAT